MGGLSIRAIGATHCLREFYFLSDSTTRPSDLPLNVIVESANSHSGNSQANVVLQMTPPLFGAKWKSPRSLSLTLTLNPFFSQNRAVFENLAVLILVNLSSLVLRLKVGSIKERIELLHWTLAILTECGRGYYRRFSKYTAIQCTYICSLFCRWLVLSQMEHWETQMWEPLTVNLCSGHLEMYICKCTSVNVHLLAFSRLDFLKVTEK